MDRWTLLCVLVLSAPLGSHGQIIDPRSPRRFETRPEIWSFHLSPIPKGIVSSKPRFTLLAPELLRADSEENVYLQADGVSDPVAVSISIVDFTRTVMLLQDSATLDPSNGFQALKTLQLPSDRLNRDENKNKFVYLKLDFGGQHSEERLMMVSFHSGYIFIQTDKPVYNPGDTVRFRVFSSSLSFKASNSTVTVDVQNPDGVVVKHVSSIRAHDGVYADTFRLSDIVSEGKWTLTSKFDDRQQNTFSAQFEVKKYVLPAFNVTLTPSKSFLNLDDSELTVAVSARYLYGEPVQGTAYVVFGLKINQEMRRLPSVKQVSDLEGGVATLCMAEIRSSYPDLRALVGNSVYVKASVLTKSGGDLVEAEKSGIKIVESPYVLVFRDPPKYYKKGLPLDFTVQVSHHDGSPAPSVQVKVNLLDAPLTVTGGSSRVTVNMPTIHTRHTITAETVQADLRSEQQAKQSITVLPYRTADRRQEHFLHISTPTNMVSVGDRLSLTLTVSPADVAERISDITYLVLSKGKIIDAKRVGVAGQLVTSIALTVTAEMMPSFRFVAFYSLLWKVREEVVPDSIWVDVADSCVGGLNVGPVNGVHRDYEPGKSFKFQIKGDPASKVSLVAVDNAVYLLSRERLTQRKIWGSVEHGDIGCTRGGGRDASAVFTDAGLLYTSSAGFKTRPRQALQCQRRSRRRRSAELLQRKVQLENHYKEKLQQRCCKDGLRDIAMPYSCTRRSFYITEGWECIRAFRYCCATFRNQEFNTEIPTTPPPLTTTPPTTTPRPVPTRPFLRDRVLYSRTFDVSARRTLQLPGLPGPPGRPGLPGLPGPPGPPGRPEWAYTMVNKAAGAKQEGQEEEEEEEEFDEEYLDETDVYLRSKFYESWLWMDLDLPDQPGTDGLASRQVDHPLPDSITEWGVLAVSASPHTGFCVAEPYNVRAWKRFFVDLKLPYSVARNEQVEIKAVVHNYGYDELHVRVVLMKTEGVCSVAFKDRHTQEVTVSAGSSVAVPYTIVPLVVGRIPLEVMVVARDMMGGDRVQKLLRVVMDGVQKTEVWSAVLNPSAEGGTQTVRIEKVELKSVVPNSVPETFINVRGNVLADSIDNSISDDSLASLIRMPGGCVEQNVASMTLPLIATIYLERTNSWDSVGVERKEEALHYIKRGYDNQLAYRRSDGSYPPYRREGASTWITAYVVKVFSMAHGVVGVSERQVCEPLVYLLKNKQLRGGTFREDNPVYSTTMTGGQRGDDPETTLTAFVLIALAEAKQAGILCSGPDMEASIQRSSDFLSKALSNAGRRPYTVAIASYALALLGRDHAPSLLAAAAGDGSFWPDSHNSLFTLEATGYAVLALLRLNRVELAAAPYKWLNGQRRKGGGFGSTQSTMVVLQALSEYLVKKPPPEDLSLDVDVRITGRREIRYHFNPKTAYAARSSRLPANLDLEVEARGNGEGILEVVTYYNQLAEVDEKKSCDYFDLNVTIEESSEKPPADVEKSYQITIKVRALGPSDVRMVVLDISLPTGFTPETSDLEMMLNSVDRYINNFQIVDNLSDRGSLIIHLFKVSHKEPEILIFRLQQSFRVGLLQPSAVTVYEYYNPDHRCSRAYSPREDREELTQICRENTCRCTQGDCCVSKADSEIFASKERETFACTGLQHVFQVKVLSVSQSYYDKYEAEIMQVIKLGVEEGVEVGQRRLFMSHGGCRESVSLQPGHQYLVMGPKDDRWNIDSDTQRFTYLLGKDTWVERWPTSAESSASSSLQDKRQRLEAAALELSVNACRL